MKQATLTFMSSHLATKKQHRSLRDTFNQFDTNGDGVISADEFCRAYRTLYPDNDPGEVDERALEVFKNADTDGSGTIDFGEWCTATINQQELLSKPNLLAAFKLFDKDGSGTIEASEVASILGHNVSDQQEVWQQVIAEVDVDGDGQISFDEFVMMFKKLAEREEMLGLNDNQDAAAAQ